MLEYLFILVCSDISIYADITEDIPYEVSVKNHDLYINRVYNELIGRNISDNYVGILDSTIFLCCNVIII